MARQRVALRTSIVSFLIVFISFLFFSPIVWAQEVSQVVQNAPGFEPVMPYQNFGNGEHVNIATGGLTVVHQSAISLPQNNGVTLRPQRVYNSKDENAAFESYHGTDVPYGPLGKNWILSYGRVFMRMGEAVRATGSGDVSLCDYYYTDETGAEHRLYLNSAIENYKGPDTSSDLLPSPNSPKDSKWYFTNDGSYIRARFTQGQDGGSWTIYYPDGSTRIAGGTNAYVQPLPASQSVQVNSDGTKWYVLGEIANLHTNGWYVTSMTDRAGNTIQISYKAFNSDLVDPPFPGSIDTITGESKEADNTTPRTIVFGYSSTGLISSITGAGLTEQYAYTTAAFDGYAQPLPVLDRVTMPNGLQTVYGYSQFADLFGNNSSFLSAIGYPTGAVSKYTYAQFGYLLCAPAGIEEATGTLSCKGGVSVGVASHSVTIHVLDVADMGATQSASTNTLTWTYDRSAPVSTYLGRSENSAPVVVTDPLGTEKAYFISMDDLSAGALPPGRDIAEIRYTPGTAFNYNSPLTGRIYEKDIHYSCGGGKLTDELMGDAQYCMYYSGNPYNSGLDIAPQADPRIYKIVESEYPASGSTAIWTKQTRRGFWDGYGHYLVQEITGTPSVPTQVTASTYNIVKSTTQYMVDELTVHYQGGATSTSGMSTVQTSGSNLPAISGGGGGGNLPTTYVASGAFKAVNYTYNGDGLPLSETSYTGIQTAFNLNLSASPWVLSSPSANTTAGDKQVTYTYDGNGNISSLTYALVPSSVIPSGSATSFQMNFAWNRGMVSAYTWQDGGSTQTVWTRSINTTNSLIASQTDANNLTTSYSYQNGLLTKISPPGEYPIQIQYPADGHQATASGLPSWTVEHVINYYKGQSGSVPTLSLPSTPSGTGSLDVMSQYVFDDLGRPFKTDTLQPDGTWSETTTFYDPLGRKVFRSEPYTAGSRTSISETDDGFIMKVPSQSGLPFGTWSSIYSDATQSAPFAGSLEPFYRVQRTVRPDDSYTSESYNGLTYTVTINSVDGIPSSTTYTKDVLGRLLSASPPQGAQAAYTYDGLNHLAQVTLTGVTNGSSQTQTRSFTYDALGRILTSSQPETGSWSFIYDAIGNVVSYTDAKGQAFTSLYDFRGRLTKTSEGGLALLSNTYDQGTAAIGKLTSSIERQLDAGGTAQSVELDYTYRSSDGRLATVSQTASAFGSNPPTLTDTLGYDAQGDLVTHNLPTNAAEALSSTYTHGFIATRVLGGTTLVSGIGYSASGVPTSISFNNGFTRQEALDAYLRPNGFKLSRNGSAVWDNGVYTPSQQGYTYDGAQNILSIGQMMSSTPNSFTYDKLSRLLSATVNHDGYEHSFTYTYDDFGNVLTRSESVPSGYSTLKAYISGTGSVAPDPYVEAVDFAAPAGGEIGTGSLGPNNRLMSVVRGGGATGEAQTTVNFQYDANGNLTADGTYAYTYDPLNRLTSVRSVATNQLVAQYFYDGSGQRAAKITYTSGTASAFTQYLRNGGAVLLERTWSLPGPTAQSEKVYVYVAGTMAVTRQTTYATSSTTYTYYAVDHLGSVRATATVDSSGNYTAQGTVIHDFEPFGVEIAPTEPDGNTHDFTGQERDPETGNDYMHFRSFESAMGRFMRPDNINGTGMNPQSWNLYSYVHGNPVTMNDPTGHLGAIEHGGTQINPDAGVGVPSSPWNQRFKMADPLNVTVRPSPKSSQQPETDMQRWGDWMAQHAPEVYRAQVKMSPEVVAGVWAHAATDIPASTGFGTFDEMLAKDVLQTKLLKSLAGPVAGVFSIFSGGEYIYGDLMHPGAAWNGTKELLSGTISGLEAAFSGEAAAFSVPVVGQVAAAGAAGWAVGSGIRHMLSDSANNFIGNKEVGLLEFFGYKP